MEKLIKQLEQELDLDQPLPQEETGSWRIPIDDNNITVTSLEPGVYLFTKLVDLPDGPIEEMMMLIGSCNLFGQATDGAVIGLEEDGKRLNLSMALPVDLDFDRFYDHLEDFINQMDYWSDTIENWEERKGALLS